MTVTLPFVFGTLSGGVDASDLDANFNALAEAINTTLTPTAGRGISINTGGTISFSPTNTPLDGATVGGNQIGGAFLSLFNSGSQTVPGTVNYSGTLTTTGALEVTSNGFYNWPNASVQPSVGLQGVIYMGGTPGGNGYIQFPIIDDVITAAGYAINGWTFLHQYNAGASGARVAMQAELEINATSTLDTLALHVGFAPFIEGNGTVPAGVDVALFCMNGAVSANNTGYTSIIWLEADMGAQYPITNILGLNVALNSNHAHQGSVIDAAFLVTSSTTLTGLSTIFMVGAPPTADKGSGLWTNTQVLKVWTTGVGGVQQPQTIATGMDFSPGYLTITGNLLAANGTTISGSGNAKFQNVAWSTGTIAAAGSNQATATPITTQDVLVNSGTGGVRLVNFNNGCECVIRNRVGASITVYPQSSAQIESAGTNVGVILANATDGRYSPFSSSQWYY